MKLFSAAAVLALAISLCGLTGDKTDAPNTNSADANANPAPSVSAAADDERHKLFQAASVTRDENVMREVSTKLGLADSNGKPNDKFPAFAKEHFSWVTRNQQFVREVNDPAKARAYVEQHK